MKENSPNKPEKSSWESVLQAVHQILKHNFKLQPDLLQGKTISMEVSAVRILLSLGTIMTSSLEPLATIHTRRHRAPQQRLPRRKLQKLYLSLIQIQIVILTTRIQVTTQKNRKRRQRKRPGSRKKKKRLRRQVRLHHNQIPTNR